MNKEKLPIIVGLALPIFFIVFVAVWISFRTSSVQPEHSFIYSISDETSPAKYGVRFENNYVIENDRIALQPVTFSKDQILNYEVRKAMDLYLYDVKNSTNRKISLDEAQKYMIDDSNSSADGYRVAFEYGNSGIFEIFGNNNENSGYFITKIDGGAKKKLNITRTNDYWNNGFRFIGWIK